MQIGTDTFVVTAFLLLLVSSSIVHGSLCDSVSTGVASCTLSGGFDPHAPSTATSTTSEPSSSSNPKLMHLWTTPIFIAQPNLRDTITFNRALSQRATTAFRLIQARVTALAASSSEHSTSSSHRGDHANGVNEQFFQWQREQHALGTKAEADYLSLSESREFLSLHAMFNSYAIGYLDSLGKGEDWRREHDGPVDQTDSINTKPFCWATVSSHGNYHLSHTHPENRISGVYYSRIPLDSGSLIFDDPRGPRWPFDGRFIHHPQPGELILFPSWLVHQVTGTYGEEERISWSCNLNGNWEDLADINLA